MPFLGASAKRMGNHLVAADQRRIVWHSDNLVLMDMDKPDTVFWWHP